ncbi:MAG: hypothetical protein R3A79_03790 [Nannocystaceae bacterium]
MITSTTTQPSGGGEALPEPSPRPLRRRLPALALAGTLAACRPGATQAPATDVEFVDIDLTEAGIGARIRAPERAAVEAEEGGEAIRITGADDFDMVVRRGGLDLWGLRCEIASARSPALIRFLEADPELLRYAVEGASGARFHFAARGEAGGVPYTCRSVGDGARTEEDLAVMVRACASVDFTSEEEAREAVPAPDELAARSDDDAPAP